MKKNVFKKAFMIIIAVFCLFSLVSPVYADGDSDDNCVPTSIIGGGEVCDDGNGSSVIHIIELVVEILTIGVGILGVIGISVVGVQYLTAGGSEEKATKAKRRLYEIIIGLALYAVLSGVLLWLLPGRNGDGSSGGVFPSGGSSGNGSSGNGSSGNGSSGNGSSGGSSSDTASLANTFQKKNGKVIYYDKNGEKVTGQQKINGAEYYFNKHGVMQTGWVKIKNSKTGKESRYYYKSNGKKAYGTIKVKSEYNEFGGKDKWYLNDKTGKLEGVDLAVPRIAQHLGSNCGPTSVLMVRAYLVGKKSYKYDGRTYPWNADTPWNELCGEAEIWPRCLAMFGYQRIATGRYEKDAALKRLFNGRPFIFRWYGNDAVAYRYAGGYGGHFMVISGYHNKTYTIKDPSGRARTSIEARLFERYWPTGFLTFYYLLKLK